MALVQKVSKRGNGGFALPNYWVAQYNAHTGRRIELTAEMKVAINRQIHVLCGAYDIDKDTIKAVMDFMFTHNPLGLDDCRGYALTVPIFSKVMTQFRAWKRDHSTFISTTAKGNVRYAVYLTALKQVAPIATSAAAADIDALLDAFVAKHG